MDTLNQAVILAGGRGERLRPLTDALPKPMAPVNGVPFLDYLVESLVQAGIRRVLVLAGYKHEVIEEAYGERINDEIEVEYSIGSVDDETGRRLLNAYDLLEDHFLLVYGDNYWPIEMEGMKRLYSEKGSRVLTTVFSNRYGTGEYGVENNVEVGADGFVRRYDKGRQSEGLNGVDIGYFIVEKKSLDVGREGNISFERDILGELIGQKELVGYVTDSQYYYITSVESLEAFESAVDEEGFRAIRHERCGKRELDGVF